MTETPITPDNLNDFMEFDHVIEVLADGTVSDDNAIYAPTMVWGKLESPRFSHSDDREWSLMSGYTGQYSYNGPSMHSSEFIGGRMARDILETPGYYVAIIDEAPCYYENSECDIEVGCDCEPSGWAVAYYHFQEGTQ